jgi:transcriptional regulator with XRE-family HTH domain
MARDIKRGIMATCKDGTMKLSDLRTSDEVLAGALCDPAFRAEWERTSVARALASQVVAYRVKHGLSQRALADELHMSQPQVARLEAAIHNPEIETLQRVASVLDIEFDLKISQRQEPTLSSRSSAKAASRSSHSRALETGVRDSGNLPKAATG